MNDFIKPLWFEKFYKNWMEKARGYDSLLDNSDIDIKLSSYFDKFFTLFVIYNALYVEATILLKRRDNHQTDEYFDSIAATDFVVKYLYARNLYPGLEKKCHSEIETVKEILEKRMFAIILDQLTGEPCFEKDKKLLADLKDGSDQKCNAILLIIYNVRCNMFHGRKSFESDQLMILTPVIKILETVIEILYKKVSKDIGIPSLTRIKQPK